MSHAQAIVFEAADLDVEVSFSGIGIGIGTGTGCLLWDGTMPPFPGLGHPPLVPGYETVGTVVRVGEPREIAVGDPVFIPGSCSLQGVRNIFGRAREACEVACGGPMCSKMMMDGRA